MTKKMLAVALPLLVLAVFAPTLARAAETQVDIPVAAFVLVNPCNGESISFAADSIHANFHVAVKNDIGHFKSTKTRI